MNEIVTALKEHANTERAHKNARFFKTGKGEYAEEDVFIGVTVPEIRKIAQHYLDTPLQALRMLLACDIHEHRLVALIILVERYKKGDDKEKKSIVTFYLDTIDRVNNWDLVDVSASHVLGEYVRVYGGKGILYTLAKSKNMWKRRVSIVATHACIRNNEFTLTKKIATMHLRDTEDLIHKATGWMLREMGKKNKQMLLTFLEKKALYMPRTMLRYAIEKFPESERKQWLRRSGSAKKSA